MLKENDSKFLDEYFKLLQSLPPDIIITEIEEDIYSIIPTSRYKINKKTALVALTHGDEVIGLHIFIKLLKRIISGQFVLEGEITLILANRKAYLANQRYIESDLNRSYGNNDNITMEEKRANIIKLAVKESDYIIDIHQCIEDTLNPFFILPYSALSYAWLLAAAPHIPIIIKNNIVKATTLSSYGFISGKMAVTFEVGARGFDNDQLKFGLDTIEDFLQFAWHQKTNVKNCIHGFKPKIYEMKYFQPYQNGSVSFVKAFKNFEDIKSNQVIVYHNEKPIIAPINGKILLYPKKWFEQNSPIKADGLFFILQPIEIKF